VSGSSIRACRASGVRSPRSRANATGARLARSRSPDLRRRPPPPRPPAFASRRLQLTSRCAPSPLPRAADVMRVVSDSLSREGRALRVFGCGSSGRNALVRLDFGHDIDRDAAVRRARAVDVVTIEGTRSPLDVRVTGRYRRSASPRPARDSVGYGSRWRAPSGLLASRTQSRACLLLRPRSFPYVARRGGLLRDKISAPAPQPTFFVFAGVVVAVADARLRRRDSSALCLRAAFHGRARQRRTHQGGIFCAGPTGVSLAGENRPPAPGRRASQACLLAGCFSRQRSSSALGCCCSTSCIAAARAAAHAWRPSSTRSLPHHVAIIVRRARRLPSRMSSFHGVRAHDRPSSPRACGTLGNIHVCLPGAPARALTVEVVATLVQESTTCHLGSLSGRCAGGPRLPVLTKNGDLVLSSLTA